MDTEISRQLGKLEEKFSALGQDMPSWLEGLLVSNPLPYWDYIHLETLLSLQNPRTDFPDEVIFIVYHQITELYFRLVLHEMEQIANNGKSVDERGADGGWNEALDAGFFVERLGRMNRYFDALTKSFDIMVEGMEPQQFLKFRMALLPASGFQSFQYRKMEICATDLVNLVDKDFRKAFQKQGRPSLSEMFEHIYWKQGAIELKSGEKTLTLKQFEEKYSSALKDIAGEYKHKNIWQKYNGLPAEARSGQELKAALRQFDQNVNVKWPLVHFKSAVRYLKEQGQDTAASGGTNWKEYLPPRHRLRIFYPSLWNAEEIENWGRLNG
ncbi:MAG: tryptophan 2,3-dioxygenase family protein [Flavobacteriales bacterium]